jgi:hypothetical protein
LPPIVRSRTPKSPTAARARAPVAADRPISDSEIAEGRGMEVVFDGVRFRTIQLDSPRDDDLD